ncbi:Guanine nucleotide-binding protein G(I)/G(S)/G(O) subunit gamma-T2 [Chelonia mydas]|uniref:Guanine nucleotide-binding protein G(I)/G(S)/G(O) subunit gamma-T2 n=1 Tax=Chelonia mydas TaxID=8469 RepID=M7BP31_CHEMY|nr:Guanine nucleotide-binding protein G(I)/G(S)/G(O) subunit gamma-T2 [Chelonia mydas]
MAQDLTEKELLKMELDQLKKEVKNEREMANGDHRQLMDRLRNIGGSDSLPPKQEINRSGLMAKSPLDIQNGAGSPLSRSPEEGCLGRQKSHPPLQPKVIEADIYEDIGK